MATYAAAPSYSPQRYVNVGVQPLQQETDSLAGKNSGPELIRTTLSKLPRTNAVKSKCNIPIGAVIQMLADIPDLPVVPNLANSRLIRCFHCRVYINCYVKFIENGNRWLCNLCGHQNEVPAEYYCPLGANGNRLDCEERTELKHSCVEFIASPDYMHRPPMAPYYLLVLDVSKGSIQSGFAASMAKAMKETLVSGKLPGLDRAQFGLITFDSNVHFYNISAGQSCPHINVISGDPQQTFVPTSDGALVHITENLYPITQLLDRLPLYWSGQSSAEVSLAGALNAAKALLRPVGGQIILGLSTMPLSPELGLNPAHSNRKADSKGRLLAASLPDDSDGLKPSSSFFAQTATALALLQISVDLVIAPPQNTPMDLATMSKLSEGTAGNLFYYPAFRPETWGSKLNEDLMKNLCTSTGWEGVMRIRISKGWRLCSYFGHFTLRGLDLLMLPCFSNRDTYTITFEPNESVVAETVCYLQAALLYTTSSGERRIRTITHALPTTLKLNEVVETIDVPTLAHVIGQKAMSEALKGKLADARSFIQTEFGNAVSVLTVCNPIVPPPADVNLPLDESNKITLAALLAVGMLKCPAFRDGKEYSADERVFYWQRLKSMSTAIVAAFYKPLLMDLTNIQGTQVGMRLDDGTVAMPWRMRLSCRSLNQAGAHVCTDGHCIYLWLGRAIAPEWIKSVFGVNALTDLNPFEAESMLVTDNPLAIQVNQVMATIRSYYPGEHMRLVVCKQGDPFEFKFITMLIEDKSHTIGAALVDIFHKYTTGAHSSTSAYAKATATNYARTGTYVAPQPYNVAPAAAVPPVMGSYQYPQMPHPGAAPSAPMVYAPQPVMCQPRPANMMPSNSQNPYQNMAPQAPNVPRGYAATRMG